MFWIFDKYAPCECLPPNLFLMINFACSQYSFKAIQEMIHRGVGFSFLLEMDIILKLEYSRLPFRIDMAQIEESLTHFNQTSGTMTGHQPWSTASISHFDPLQSNSTSLYQQSHPQHSSYYSPGQNPPPQFLPSQQQQQQGLLNMQPTQNLETISAHTGYNTYANSNLQGNFYIPPTFGTDLTQQQFQQPQQTQQTYQNYQQPQPLQQQQHQPIYRHAPVDAASLLKSREVRRVECPVCHKTIEGDDPAINYHVNEHYS
ncbi:uncharacterized protein BX664DRAFT_317870 [Halteromyces radiatus]|uniref:uncharacterized protein n=1 Tax=Halteromyces radiatus TaxID=101107 RepID=UPI00221EB20F|nr:uncharacterized protein BX664DRAFT_317870 [Halteromyces radiatus]KAI8079981.1 hypothetical protein BX664DRAFT_317870 [Halteromyces radiatus]